ncbi:hypothetical protein ACWDCO_24430 [Streptomyces albogriseolus]
MGAALHLAHAHQPAPGPRRKRKGGGGSNDGYDAFVARVYQDKRLSSATRDLILLMAWLRYRDPNRHDSTLSYWERAGNVLGRYKVGTKEKPRLADVIADDRPRYEIDYTADEWQRRACNAPMIRRDGECGQKPVAHSMKYDANGWASPVWYCRRHADWGRKQEIAEREARKTAPAPVPNAGGLLPSYLTLNSGDEGWVRVYEWACAWTWNRGWKPPEPYGLRADDWPTVGEEPVEMWEPPRLRLATKDGELVGP